MWFRQIGSTLFVLGLLAIWAPGVAQGQEDDRAALVVVDIQLFYFAGGDLPLEGSVEASQVAKGVLARFRALGWPVVHVQHLPKGQNEPGQEVEPEAYRIHPDVAPKTGEKVIGKHHANAFRATELAEELRRLGVRRLVIVGMQTHMCVEAVTRAAADLDFEVTLVHDACATRALEFAGTTVPAKQVHAAVLAAMNGTYARVISAEELLAELSRDSGAK